MVCASLPRNQSFVDYVSQIGRSVEKKIHITLLLRELLHSLDKYFKDDLKTPLTLAVRLAFLVSTPFASQSPIYEGILWTKCTTYSVLQDFDQWRRVKRSEGEWR